MANFWTGRPGIVTAFALTLLGFIYISTSPTSTAFIMSKAGSSSSSNVPGLDIKLTQTSRNPPVLAVTLKNNSPDKPYTILKWGTPLDSAALNTGVFSIVKEDGGEEVEQMVMQINRMMPPGDEEFVTVAPGTEEEIEVAFDKPWMPDTKPAKYKVKAEGVFKGLWDKYGSDVTEADRNAYIESPFSGKHFATNEVVMEVH